MSTRRGRGRLAPPVLPPLPADLARWQWERQEHRLRLVSAAGRATPWRDEDEATEIIVIAQRIGRVLELDDGHADGSGMHPEPPVSDLSQHKELYTMSDIKIVIVSGQEFSVPADTANEAIRESLKSSFPDVGTAEIKTSKRTVEGHGEVEVIEFVKKAGTKGLDGAALADLLAHIPAQALPRLPRQQISPILRDLLDGHLTCADALAHHDALIAALDAATPVDVRLSQEGAVLCRTLDALPAVAAPAPAGW